MRYLAIGDIHGYAEVLRRLLEAVQPQPEDEIITLGDYVDRGPDSRGVLDEMIALNRNARLIALRGNHDFMMLEARKGPDALREWCSCGGRTTLESYGDSLHEGRLEEVPDEHWQFLEEVCVDWYEIDTHFFVHANVDPSYELVDQPLYQLHWEPLCEDRQHCSGKIMVCGHTKQRTGKPKNWGHAVCLDTWVYGEGWLTCMDVKTGELWQANRHGELCTGSLENGETR
jgi:serine/threonine protein phosphatase 1